ncbi:hypothetical protein RISK_005368 [Rhodopirellula islandica]|uniref:Uncharacterized protein n=1 Tax=Rhodopirellula islandica TaxID=595434 RepID=A0A0J1B6E2_RHOIS|nr:hypothetical protein RISK_005368 [Rhodopirellula islandica]
MVMRVLFPESSQFAALLIGLNLCEYACRPCHDLTPLIAGRNPPCIAA